VGGGVDVTGQQLPDVVARRRGALHAALGRYERLIEIRLVEDRIVELFRLGKVSGTTHTSQGQEAVAVAIGTALSVDDVVACTYRGHAIALALGLTPVAVLGEVLGRSVGCVGGVAGSMHMSMPAVGLLPTSAIVGAGLPIAVGAALSAKILGKPSVAVSVFGDGAANIGAFHEALNLAAVWQLPVVFICENNLYGEYSPVRATTPIDDIARRAVSYAMPWEVVDGQDVDLMTEAIARAVQRAREEGGPTLIEAKTYRYVGHSRSDPAAYRPAGELAEWRQRDPLALYQDKLIASGVISLDAAADVRAKISAEIEASVQAAEDSDPPEPIEMFSHVLA
jgi:TPP-dependent pyruvate/acetoin dehydrogenase alpha subunit